MTKAAAYPNSSDWLQDSSAQVRLGNDSSNGSGKVDSLQASTIIRSYADKFDWEFPRHKVLFFCDLHADAEAFRRSLLAAYAITEHSSALLDVSLTDLGKSADIVIAGDIFDKGPSNYDLLDLLTLLRDQGAKFKILAGNHDIRIWLTLKAIGEGDREQIDYLASSLERAFLIISESLQRAEVLKPHLSEAGADHKSTSQESPCKSNDEADVYEQLFFPSHCIQASPGANHQWGESKAEIKLTKQRNAWLAERWQEIKRFYASKGIEPSQILEGLRLAKRMIVASDSRYAWLFAEMNLMTHYGSFLLAHGGVDDELCQMIYDQGIAVINAKFKDLMRQGKPRELISGPFGNCTLTKYRYHDEPLSAKGIRLLHELQICAIVHGHDNQVGQQNIVYRQEMLHFQCDASLNRCTRELQGLSPTGMAVIVFEPEGRLVALSNEWPAGKSFAPRDLQAAKPLFRSLLQWL